MTTVKCGATAKMSPQSFLLFLLLRVFRVPFNEVLPRQTNVEFDLDNIL
jgi:hypothetical protein